MDDTLKKRMADLVDGVIKLRLLATLPDEFLNFIASMETQPTAQNLAKLESYYAELAKYLQARADAYRPAIPRRGCFFKPASKTAAGVKDSHGR